MCDCRFSFSTPSLVSLSIHGKGCCLTQGLMNWHSIASTYAKKRLIKQGHGWRNLCMHGSKKGFASQARRSEKKSGDVSSEKSLRANRHKSKDKDSSTTNDRQQINNIESDISSENSDVEDGDSKFGSAPDSQEFQPVPRGRVLAVCIRSSLVISAVALAWQQAALRIISLSSDLDRLEHVEALLSWNDQFHLSIENIAVAALTAGCITGARFGLLMMWADFRKATDVSNAQVLTSLGGNIDIAIVSILPAISEEFLFRGALLPSISPDWRGAIIAGIVFGALHVPGGRNIAFAAWASFVGTMYGMIFLQTGTIVVPVLAHAIANTSSALLWIARQEEKNQL